MPADDVARIDVVRIDVVPLDAMPGAGEPGEDEPDELIGAPPDGSARRMPRTFAAILAVGALAVGGWSAVRQDRDRPRPASIRPTAAPTPAPGIAPAGPYFFEGDRFGKTAPPGVEAATCADPTNGARTTVVAEPPPVQAAIRAHLPGFVVDAVARTSRPRTREFCGAVVRAHRPDGSRLTVTVDGTAVPDLGYSVDAWIEDGMVTTHVSRIMTPVVIDIVLAVPRGASATADAAVRALAEDPRLHS